MDIAARIVVLDTVLDEIHDSKRKLYLINLRCDRSEALQHQLHILLLSNRPEPLKQSLQHVIYIYRGNIQGST